MPSADLICPIEDMIAYINEEGWHLKSLSQYRFNSKEVRWSATVRRDGPYRQPIGRGYANNPLEAICAAFDSRDEADLEPETTVHVVPTEPPMTLANLLPIPPLITPTIIRRR
jgi:hypothetical protein